MIRYVIIRDDDTNALTDPECLERLYTPFFQRNLPINLAVIPNVSTETRLPDGTLEGFLTACNKKIKKANISLYENPDLVKYLKKHQNLEILQHGYEHIKNEFDSNDRLDLMMRIEKGLSCFEKAGFSKPKTFVAPYDKISRPAYQELVKRFEIISTGWFELGRIPLSWIPSYLLKKLNQKPHWKVDKTLLLSHPGCLLSCQKNYEKIFDTVKTTMGNPSNHSFSDSLVGILQRTKTR